MTIHELKTWPDVFHEMWTGKRCHEFRKDDRDFKVDDDLALLEFEPWGERYTGRAVIATVTAMSTGPEWGIPVGYAVMSLFIRCRRDSYHTPEVGGGIRGSA